MDTSCISTLFSFKVDQNIFNWSLFATVKYKGFVHVVLYWYFQTVVLSWKGHRLWDSQWHGCSIPEDSAPWGQIQSCLIRAFQGLSVALYVSDPTHERGLAQRPGDGKVGGGQWLDSGPQVTWTLLISHSMARNHLLGFLRWNLLPQPRLWSMSFQIKP